MSIKRTEKSAKSSNFAWAIVGMGVMSGMCMLPLIAGGEAFSELLELFIIAVGFTLFVGVIFSIMISLRFNTDETVVNYSYEHDPEASEAENIKAQIIVARSKRFVNTAKVARLEKQLDDVRLRQSFSKRKSEERELEPEYTPFMLPEEWNPKQ